SHRVCRTHHVPSSAISFLGGFRTPATAHSAPSFMAGIRNPAHSTQAVIGQCHSITGEQRPRQSLLVRHSGQVLPTSVCRIPLANFFHYYLPGRRPALAGRYERIAFCLGSCGLRSVSPAVVTL